MRDITWQRFWENDGALFAAFDSLRLQKLKLEDDIAFARFRQNPDNAKTLTKLLPLCSPEDLATTRIHSSIAGEYFCRLKISRDVKIKAEVNILAHGGVDIHDGVRIENDVQIVTVSHGLHPTQRHFIRTAPIVIEEGAVIQQGAIIVNAGTDGKPLTIGAGATVLAGSVITSDVPAGATVSGKTQKPVASLREKGPLAPHWQYPASNHTPAGCIVIDTQAALADFNPTLRSIMPVYLRKPENITMGQNCLMNRKSVIRADGKVDIGDRVLIAPGVEITVEDGGKLEIGNDVWFGAGAEVRVTKGQHLRIDSGSLVAAGARVSSDVPANTLVVGDNRILREIGAADIEQVPERWSDQGYVSKKLQKTRDWNRQQRLKNNF